MFSIFASTVAPEIFRILLFPIFMWPMSFPVDIENDMMEQEIPFEIVEEMPDRFNTKEGTFAYYSCEEDMIFFVSTDGNFSYDEFLVSAVHEMIHYHRDQSGQWTGDSRTEEAIAIYGASRLSSIMGMDSFSHSSKETDEWFLSTLENNRLDTVLLSVSERIIVEAEIERLKEYILDIEIQKKYTAEKMRENELLNAPIKNSLLEEWK